MQEKTYTPREFVREKTIGNGLENQIENLVVLLDITHASICSHLSAIEENQHNLKNIIHEYNEDRRALFAERLVESGLGWCMECRQIVALHDLQLLCKTRQRSSKTYSTEHEGFFEDYISIYTVCPSCHNKAWDDPDARRLEINERGVFVKYRDELLPITGKVEVEATPGINSCRPFWYYDMNAEKMLQETLERFAIPDAIDYIPDGNFPKVRIGKTTLGSYDSPKIELVK